MKMDDIKEILDRVAFKNNFIDLKRIILDTIIAIKETGAKEEETIAFMHGIYYSLEPLKPYTPLVEYWIKEVYKGDTE